MKTITARLKIDPQKFEAAQQFMEEKGIDINVELSKAVEDFYKKFVPSAVRKYIERSSATPCAHAAKPSHPAPTGPSEFGSGEPDSDSTLKDFGSGGSYKAICRRYLSLQFSWFCSPLS
jgi:hypothetical protein